MTDQDDFYLKKHFSQITMDNSAVSKSVDLRSQHIEPPFQQKGGNQSLNNLKASQSSQHEIELIKPIQDAANTTEFLMLTLQKALNYQPSQVQELLTNTNQYLMQACDRGIKGDFSQVLNWFQSLILYMPKMIQLFRIAYAQNGALEVTLVLSSIRCGFFSQNQQVCAISIEVLERISEDFYQKPIELGLQVQKYKTKQKYYGATVAEIKIPVFQQFQEWFVRSTKPPKLFNKRYMKAGQKIQHLGDPSSVLRVACTEVLQNHSELSPNVTRLILSIFRDPTVQSSPITLKNLPELLAEVLADDLYLCYEALSVILPCIRDFDRGSLQKILVDSDLILKLLELSSESTSDTAVRLQCTTLLFDLWYLEPIIVCNPREGVSVKETINEVILAGLLHQDKVYRLTIYGCAFSVLSLLIDLKSSEAPPLLKTIITGILNHMSGPFKKDKITQEFVLQNLIDLFQGRPDIPVNVLIEPVAEIFSERLKGEQAESTGKIKPGNLSNQEIGFLMKIAGHNKLTISTVTPLLELLGTIYMTKPLLSATILNPIIYLIDRFFEKSKQVKNVVINFFVKKAISTILSLRKEEQLLSSGSIRPLAITAAGGPQEAKVKKPRHFLAQEKLASAEMTRKIQRFNMVRLVEFLYQLNLNQIQDTIVEQVKVNSDKYYSVFKVTSSAYDYLIKRLGLNIQSQDSYGGETGNPDNRNSEYQDSNDPNYPNGTIMLRSSSQEVLDRKRLEKEKAAKSRQRQLQWSEVKDPSNEIALRAIEEMHYIKQQRIRKQNAERIEEIQKKEKMEKLIDSSTIDVAMRNLILQKEAAQRKNKIKDILAGKYKTEQSEPNTSSLLQNPFHPNILEDMQRPGLKNPIDEREQKVILSLSRVPRDGIVLVNFEFEEEERERDTMRLLVFRYQNLFRYLFNRYSSTGQQNKRRSGMEIVREPLITIVEIVKFLKENGVDASLISQRETGIIVKMINDCMFLRHAGTALDFAGFVQLIIQLSIYIYRKGRVKEIPARDALSLFCYDLVKLMLQRFQDQALKRGENVLIFDVPLAMLSIGGEIDEKQALALKNANQSKNPPAAKLNFQTNQSRVVAVEMVFKPNQNLKMIMGDAKFNVLEILNEVVQREFGICLFEGVLTAKEKIELSILPQISGLPLQNVADQKQKANKVPEKAPLQTIKSTDTKKPTDKSKDQKGNNTKQQHTIHPPPNFEIYTVEKLVKQIPQRSQQIRNARLDKENEQILMEAPWSPAIKVACFELQQIKPQSQLSDMREVAQLLEDMLMCTSEHKKYLSKAEREVRKRQKASTRIIQKINDQIQLTPQVNLESKKKREEIEKIRRDQEEEQKQLKNIEFAKRGVILKEQVQVLKQQKEEKEIQERMIKEAQEEQERAKKEKIDEKLRRFQEKENRERNARAEAKALKENQEKLKVEFETEYEKQKLILAEETNKCIQGFRQRYAQEHGENEEPYQARKAKELVDFYRQASTTVALQQAEPVFKKAFYQVIEQQNVTSRLHGSPLHKGLNLDGVISLCIRLGVIPNLIAVDDLIHMIKMQLRDRQYMPVEVQSNQSSLEIIVTNPTPMQLINFENKGGHFTFEEFQLILVRALTLANKNETLDRQAKTNINQYVMVSSYYQKAQNLNYQQQSWELIEKIVNCQQQIVTFIRINKQLNELAMLYAAQIQNGGKPKFYPLNIQPSTVTSQDFNNLIDFLVETLRKFKLTKLPLKASSYQPVLESPNRPPILNRRSNSVSVSMDQLVLKPLQRQKIDNKVSPKIAEVDNYRIPVKSDIAKPKAVNAKRASKPQANQDLKPVGVEVKRQASVAGRNFQELSYSQQKQNHYDDPNEYQDPLENSHEDSFADYSIMFSPSKRD